MEKTTESNKNLGYVAAAYNYYSKMVAEQEDKFYHMAPGPGKVAAQTDLKYLEQIQDSLADAIKEIEAAYK